jgi:hypothetical protein
MYWSGGMKHSSTPKVWYKRKLFWTAAAAALGAVFDLSIGEQSLIVEVALAIVGVI